MVILSNILFCSLWIFTNGQFLNHLGVSYLFVRVCIFLNKHTLTCIYTHTAHTQVAPNVHTRSHSPVLRGCAGCAGKEKARHPDLGAARSRGCGRGSGGGPADLGSQRALRGARGREGGSVSLETVNSPAVRRLSRAPSGPARPRPGPRPLWPLATPPDEAGLR